MPVLASARVVSAFVFTNSFRKEKRQYSKHATVTLTRATNYMPDLIAAAHRALQCIY